MVGDEMPDMQEVVHCRVPDCRTNTLYFQHTSLMATGGRVSSAQTSLFPPHPSTMQPLSGSLDFWRRQRMKSIFENSMKLWGGQSCFGLHYITLHCMPTSY
jgi:hypothetical protein